MKQDTTRHIAAWLLLAVFVPMVVLSSVHVHKERVAVATTECADCVHHNCHGHMTTMPHWSHDCVLCQFLTLTFLVPTTVCITYINKVVDEKSDAQRRNVCVAHSGIVGLRAPPAFSI
ncbi:MAG: hypothetical protein K6C30_07170 [Bacteroidaceae bacterium]|nr:hypothetical protein [Bacteroidaceae bacterium]